MKLLHHLDVAYYLSRFLGPSHTYYSHYRVSPMGFRDGKATINMAIKLLGAGEKGK